MYLKKRRASGPRVAAGRKGDLGQFYKSYEISKTEIEKIYFEFLENLATEYDGLTDSSGDEEYLLNNLDSELDVRVIHPPKAPPKDYQITSGSTRKYQKLESIFSSLPLITKCNQNLSKTKF